MLILASQSPRRRELLHQAGIAFVVRPANVDETIRAGESPDAYVKRVAQEKATAVEASAADIVLGADTVVVIDGQILGKPRDPADALRMLETLSGREHTVLTGICLRRATEKVLDVAETRVWFLSLTGRELQEYVATAEPMDKAGAYAIQGLASKFVRRIEGSYTNVVGLPVELVHQYLRRWDHS
jgi:nucleoside triphosphate pyrophosphatase